MKSFLDAINAPAFAPGGPAKMPLAEGGAGVNAAQAWLDAISGNAPQFLGLADTVAAAKQWTSQPFNDPSDAATAALVAEGKARVAAATARYEAVKR